jgi:alpha-D-xyloside xylohydrolase
MQIERAYTGLGDTLSRGYVTWLVYPDKDQTSAFSIYSTDEQQPTSLRTSFVDEELQLTFEGKHSPHILRIHLESQPQSLHLDGRELTDFEYDKDRQQLVIKTMDYLEGKYVIRF